MNTTPETDIVEKRPDKVKNGIKTGVKLLLSVLIVYLVLRQIDEKILLQIVATANPLWLFWAMVFFVVSKLIGAVRFRQLLQTENINIGQRANLRLYWLGMYYNLLLPGGISGDGYKIKLLMDAFGTPFKPLFALTLLDRLSGVTALGQWVLVLALGIDALTPWRWAIVLLLVASVPVTYFLYQKMGSEKLRVIWLSSNLLSVAVQGAQLISTLGIVFALGEGDHWLSYSVLFLVSSVVAMLPLTIGGTGARELTFLYGAGLLGVDSEKAVAIAFLFYLISTAAALFGMVYGFTPLKLTSQTTPAT